MPSYPEAALPSEVACSAKLLYHIQTDGSAWLVRLEWAVPPPQDHRDSFEEALSEAVAEWRFTPARELAPKKMPDGSIEPEPRPIPTAVNAIIRFRMEEGKPVVEQATDRGDPENR